MSNTITDNDRRRFVKISMIGLTLAPVANLLLNRNAEARGSRGVTGMPRETPKLPENDRQAFALGYKEDAGLVNITQ